MIDRAKLRRFLNKAIGEPRQGRDCMTIQLRHLTGEDSSEGVDTWPIRVPPSPKVLIELDVLVNEIEDRAQDEANDLGGVQQYAVVPYYGAGNTSPGGRKILKLRGRDDDDDEEEGGRKIRKSDERTEKGVLGMLMRHAEEKHQQENDAIMRSQQRIENENNALRAQVASLQNTIDKKDGLLEAFLQGRVKTVEFVETLMSQAHQRNLATEASKVRLDVFKSLADKAQNLLPTVVNYLAGTMAMPMGNHPILESMKSVITTIKPEQFAMLAMALDETQFAALQKAAEMMVEEDERKKAQEKAMALVSAVPSTKALAETVTNNPETSGSPS